MGIGPIAGMAAGFISSFLSNATGSTAGSPTASAPAKQDTSHVSSFAQILGSLQQLQQSNPAQYSQVTNQIAANLQSAAQTATSSGNTSLASQLTSLSKEFQTASATGQLPIPSNIGETLEGANHHGSHHAAHNNAATDPLSIIGNTLTNAGVPTTAS